MFLAKPRICSILIKRDSPSCSRMTSPRRVVKKRTSLRRVSVAGDFWVVLSCVITLGSMCLPSGRIYHILFILTPNIFCYSTCMGHQQIVTGFFIALLVFIIYQVLWILSPFARPIFWAAILAFAFYPVHLKIKTALKGHENTPAVVTSFLIFATFVPLAIFVVASLVGEVLRFSELATGFVRDGGLAEFLLKLESHPMIQKIQQALFRSE